MAWWVVQACIEPVRPVPASCDILFLANAAIGEQVVVETIHIPFISVASTCVVCM